MNIFEDLGVKKNEDKFEDTEFEYNGIRYVYCGFYDHVSLLPEDRDVNAAVESTIRCPYCWSDKFSIGYGSYECIAICGCGHKMVVYDG